MSKPKPKLISRNRSIREYLNKNKRYNNVQGQRSVAKKITPIKSEQERTTSVEQNTEITSSKPEQQEITMKIQENSIITSSLESTITSNKSEHKITSQDNDEQEIVDYQKKIFVKLKPPSIFEKPKITRKRTKKNIDQDNTSKIYTFFKPINNKETPELRISNNKLVHTDVRRDIHSTVFQTTASTPEVDLPTNPVINLQNSLVTGLPGRTEDRSVRQMLNHGSANLLLEKKGCTFENVSKFL